MSEQEDVLSYECFIIKLSRETKLDISNITIEELSTALEDVYLYYLFTRDFEKAKQRFLSHFSSHFSEKS